MDFVHIGLVSSTEENAERFFGQLLGLPKTRESQLPREITDGLFGVDRDCKIVYFGDAGLVFEVFVTGFAEDLPNRISHTCIEVDDAEDLVRRAREKKFEVREVPKGEKMIRFLADADGNLFEIKAR